MKKKTWRHKRFGKKNYYGAYRRVDGEREFVLKRVGGGHVFVAESHQAAMRSGWYTL